MITFLAFKPLSEIVTEIDGHEYIKTSLRFGDVGNGKRGIYETNRPELFRVQRKDENYAYAWLGRCGKAIPIRVDNIPDGGMIKRQPNSEAGNDN